MKRLYLTMDDRLFEAIETAAREKGILPSSLVVSNLEDLYLKKEAVEYGAILEQLFKEAQAMPAGQPFLLAELPSFSALVISSAKKAHISPSPIRARLGKSFNLAVRTGKVGKVKRAVRGNGKLMNHAGVAMYVI